MTVEYYKGTACPILLSNKEWAIALTVDSAKKLQEDLAKIIERAEKESEMTEFEKCVKHLMEETIEAGDTHNLKPDSEMLLRMAKQQLLQSGELLTQEHHKKLMETLREECKKDLPRWRFWRNGACGNSDGNPIALVKESCGYKLVSYLCADGEKYIMLSGLEKLPGFKEED